MQGVSRNLRRVTGGICATVLMLLCVAMATGQAAHAEDRRVVTLGFGVGLLGGTGGDSLRQPLHRDFRDADGDALSDGKAINYFSSYGAFLEAYPGDTFAIGIRHDEAIGERKIDWGDTRKVTMFGESVRRGQYAEAVLTATTLLTGTWVSDQSATGTRWGAQVGAGQMAYTYRQDFTKTESTGFLGKFLCFFIFCGDTYQSPVHSEIESATVPVFSVGGFWDFGGDGFGGRLGATLLGTSGGTLKATQPDGQKREFTIAPPPLEFYFRFRWDI